MLCVFANMPPSSECCCSKGTCWTTCTVPLLTQNLPRADVRTKCHIQNAPPSEICKKPKLMTPLQETLR